MSDGRQKDFYRYNTAGFNVGGPAYIPGKFNRNKDKLFFFVGIEWQKQLVPQGLHNVTVPTALERERAISRRRTMAAAPRSRFSIPPTASSLSPAMSSPRAGLTRTASRS